MYISRITFIISILYFIYFQIFKIISMPYFYHQKGNKYLKIRNTYKHSSVSPLIFSDTSIKRVYDR